MTQIYIQTYTTVILVFFLNSFIKAQTKIYENKVFDKKIKTIQIYQQEQPSYSPNYSLKPPLLSLHASYPLTLTFDNLSIDFVDFRCKVVHCNADWSASVLNEIEFLSEYNDFAIQDFKQSFATKMPYYHYAVAIPKTKVAGNFIIYVYKNRDENDSVLVKRFSIFDNKMSVVDAKVLFANDALYRDKYQEINFSINYAGHQILNPQKDLKVFIRQNFRDDKIKKMPSPFMVNDSRKIIEYQFFENENIFQGGNEYRLVDLRSTQSRLRNVASIRHDEDISKVFVRIDEPQSNQAYVQSPDFDGMQVIDNYETHRGETDADYIEVNFQLNSKKQYKGDVYLNGIFNDWEINETNKLTYNELKNGYTGSFLLKQGVFNYNYIFKNPNNSIDEYDIENSYSLTQNTYEIFIYHKPVGARAEYLLGYQIISSSK